MEVKKSKKADLESKRNTFLLFGLVVALGVTLVAFEWTTKPSKAASLGQIESQEVEEEFIPITREQEVQPPPPPPPPKVVEVLNIVDDDVEIEEEEDVEEKIWFNIIEDPAEFPGGDKALYNYISKNVNYPVIAQENGIQGKVYVKFVVNKQGKVSDGQVLRGVDTSLDKEALRVINSLPDFKPGKQRGKPVKVFYNAVINFQLQ